jgi:hypothetical protein
VESGTTVAGVAAVDGLTCVSRIDADEDRLASHAPRATGAVFLSRGSAGVVDELATTGGDDTQLHLLLGIGRRAPRKCTVSAPSARHQREGVDLTGLPLVRDHRTHYAAPPSCLSFRQEGSRQAALVSYAHSCGVLVVVSAALAAGVFRTAGLQGTGA